jgi:hypothetical protein
MQLPEIVKLDIGGTFYTTTRSTLCKYTDSMLAAMFSGNFPVCEFEGRAFIDRDGELFKYILQFLRTNSIEEEFNPDLLLQEAQFYGLTGLEALIRKDGKDEKQHVKDEKEKETSSSSLKYLTKNGSFIECDISFETCRKFGFFYGDRVKTPKGDATAIGFFDGSLWFHIDMDPGASYWQGLTSFEMFKKNDFKLLDSTKLKIVQKSINLVS